MGPSLALFCSLQPFGLLQEYGWRRHATHGPPSITAYTTHTHTHTHSLSHVHDILYFHVRMYLKFQGSYCLPTT